ncbi:MAG: glycosyltransferase, partial [Candidatus Hydrogenedens sp.]
KIPNINTFTLPLRSELDLYSAWKIATITRKNKIDIIHAHTSHAHSLALLSTFFYATPKIVVSRRVSFPPAKNVFSQWKYNHIDLIIPVSYYVAKILKEHGVAENKIQVVRSSIDLSHIDVPPYKKSELAIDETTKILLNAGALVPHKDHITLLHAFVKVKEIFNDIVLLLAGSGPLQNDIQTEIEKLHLSQHVRLLGYRSDVPRLIRTSDLYVSSSWSEGLGTSILEALASKKPVVATEAGGVSEMVINHKTGLLVPNKNPQLLAEAIIYMLSHPDESMAMAEKGRKHVEDNFTVQRMIDETISVYQKLIQ